MGRIRGALDLHPACIGGALQRSLSQGRKELGAGKRATTALHSDRPSLSPPSLSQPACPLSSRPSGEGRGQTSRLNYVLGEDDLGRIFKAICSSLQIVLHNFDEKSLLLYFLSRCHLHLLPCQSAELDSASSWRARVCPPSCAPPAPPSLFSRPSVRSPR